LITGLATSSLTSSSSSSLTSWNFLDGVMTTGGEAGDSLLMVEYGLAMGILYSGW
jgi:hypothetical protein